MNITKQQSDALNAVITINIEKSDYAEKIDKALNDYRKSATIPGFRKGHIPMSIIKNRYKKAILLDEINKILQQSLNNYINEEKLDILGSPIPVPKDDLDLDTDNFSFDFEVGLTPEFSVDLNIENNIHYKIKVDQNLVDKEIETIQKKYAKLFPKEQSEQGDELTGVFTNQTTNHSVEAILSTTLFNIETIEKIKKGTYNEFFFTVSINKLISQNKEIADRFIGKKTGDIITFSVKDLYLEETEEPNEGLSVLGISPNKITEKNIDITFTISEINGYQPAEITQEILDKVYEKGGLKSPEELKQKIQTNHEENYKNYTDPRFFNDTFDILIENTKFDLPTDFLKKWIQHTSENPLTDQQIEEEYKRASEELRYVLIEQKIIKQNNLVVTFEEMKDFAFLKTKIELYKEYRESVDLEQIEEEAKQKVGQILSDKKEFENISKSIMNNKLFDLFIEKTKPELKEVSFEEFMKISNEK